MHVWLSICVGLCDSVYLSIAYTFVGTFGEGEGAQKLIKEMFISLKSFNADHLNHVSAESVNHGLYYNM